MVDARTPQCDSEESHAGDKSIQPLLDWLATYKGFHSRLDLLSASHAGRGLFAYTKAIQPGEPMLNIPAAALLNPLTLQKSALNTIPSELFPIATSSRSSPPRSPIGAPRLTTTQLLSLHLALHKDPKQRHKSEWAIFIDTLPSFRPWHPLTWVVPNSDVEEQDDWWPRLEESQSESVRIKIEAVRKRYVADLEVLRTVLRNVEPFKSQGIGADISDETLLWAWLNVNTRTVTVPLGLVEPANAAWHVNNHSFVPLLDMINHSSIPSVICPKPEPLPSTNVTKRWGRGSINNARQHLVPGKVDIVLFAPLRGLSEGEEVTFLYGAHSNAMLFAEYGFTEVDEMGDALSWPNGDIDVSPWVKKLWEDAHPDLEVAHAKREALQLAGLWNHNKLTANLGDPQPSIGLMATLCVMVAPLPENGLAPSTLHARNFARPTKLAARRHLARICEAVLRDAKDCKEDVKELVAEAKGDKSKLASAGVVRALLKEEEAIARGVLETIESGGSIPGF